MNCLRVRKPDLTHNLRNYQKALQSHNLNNHREIVVEAEEEVARAVHVVADVYSADDDFSKVFFEVLHILCVHVLYFFLISEADNHRDLESAGIPRFLHLSAVASASFFLRWDKADSLILV